MSRYYGYRAGRRGPHVVFSIFLILAGVVLFLANLNLLPISVHQVWDFWPLIFVAMGLGKIIRMRHPFAVILGAMLVLFGLMYTLVNIGIFHIHVHDDSWPLSILFLALGLAGLARVLDGGNPRWRERNFPGPPNVDPGFPPNPLAPNPWFQNNMADSTPILDHYTVMGSINRKVESQSFQGGKLTSIMGNIEIDLRRAKMVDGKNIAYIEAHAIMGAIKLRVPDSWRVVWNGDNVMGNFEDKSIPPVTGGNAPQLIVTGSSVMGNIEVDS